MSSIGRGRAANSERSVFGGVHRINWFQSFTCIENDVERKERGETRGMACYT